MDPATFLVAIERITSAGGLPMAIFALIAWSWLQDRKHRPETDSSEFRRNVLDRIIALESLMKLMWDDRHHKDK